MLLDIPKIQTVRGLKKIGSDANDNVEVLHYRNDGYGLRSSMVGDTFTIWFNNKEYKKFKCMPIGFQEVA